ncbi:MAG: MBL fold metallo-hydrolase [Spirochaetales bacterium]|jgi:hypothetical protein|nr:MBL fold metallo-hydrolase [Spirochaetales bacterium]
MVEFKHRRQQWAVGHGFFHTASIDIQGHTYRYIYDCGSKGQSTVSREIDRYITNEALEGRSSDIDMLVVSHFHTDHIKGIPYLLSKAKVKNLIIPYLSMDAQLSTLAQLASLGYQELDDFSELIVNPSSWMRTQGSDEVQVTQISSGEVGGNDSENPVVDNGISINPGKVSHEVSCNIFLQRNPFWQFKFYTEENATLATTITDMILAATGSNRSELESNLLDSDWIRQNWESLKNAYTSIGSDKQNITNLSMFSGPVGDFGSMFANFQPGCSQSVYYHLMRELQGWLGTGDAELKSPRSFSAFEKHFNNLLRQVDTVTVPHHGALKNYNAKIGDIGVRHVITANSEVDPKGHHPASEVMVNLKTKSSSLNVVTKDESTALFDSFIGLLVR